MDIDKEWESQYERYKQLGKIDHKIVKNNKRIRYIDNLLTGCVKILGLLFALLILLLSTYRVIMDGSIMYYAFDISNIVNNFDVSSKVFLLLIISIFIIPYAALNIILKLTEGRICKAKEKD